MKIRNILISIALFFTFLNAEELKMPIAFESQFVQEIISPSKKKIRYTGKVQYSKSSLLKWQYISPTKKEVCTDGKELVIVDHDLEQISFYTIDKGFDLSAVLENAKKTKEWQLYGSLPKKELLYKLECQWAIGRHCI